MSFLGLKLPHETARLLSDVDYGGVGKAEAPGFYHITMLYLGKDVPVETLSQAVPVVFGVTSRTKPFTVGTNRVTTFPAGKDGVPVICRVVSDALHALRQELTEAFDAAGVSYDMKFPEFKPHVTLAFAPEDELPDGLDKEFPLVEWGAHELVLWGGDTGDKKLVITFPFSMEQTKAAANRAFVKLATAMQPPQPPLPHRT